MSLIDQMGTLMGGSRHRRRRSRKLRGGSKHVSLVETAAPVGGKRSRRRRTRSRTRRRSCKKGGNGLVPLGLLGTLLAVGPRKHRGSKRRGSKRRGSKRRRR